MTDVTREEMMNEALRAMTQQNKRIAPVVGRANKLLSDFPDEIVDPWNDKELKVGKRIIQANITEADEIVVNIRMIDGSVGQLTIKATTLAQIIIDRNAQALPDQSKTPDPTCIDVGDGGIGGGEQTHQKVVKLVNADELLAASRKRASP